MNSKSVVFPEFGEILKVARALKKNLYPNGIKIAFLRNSTLERLVPYLEYMLLLNQIRPTFYFSEYDNYFQEVLGESNELTVFNPNVIIVSMDSRLELDAIFYDYTSLSQEDAKSHLESTRVKIESVILGLRKKFDVPIILNGFELPSYPTLGLLDAQNPRGQVSSIRLLNLELVSFCNNMKGVYFLDLDLVLQRSGGENSLDNRFWFIEKNPYSQKLLQELTIEYFHFIANFKGILKKVLVLDLDNTIWGGIVGEDGLNGVKLGHTYPGSAFVDFQRAILDIYRKGVLLAICSKNNMSDVLDVIRNHPDMVLREEHFTIIKANWENKVKNIREIADELNVGLNSLVFIDDNPFEVEAVKAEIPEVLSILMPKDNPTGYRIHLSLYPIFNFITLSDEDKSRSQMYRQETRRNVLRADFTNVDDYLRSLEMNAYFNLNDHFCSARVAQLCQRTNQFNLTTIRYSDVEITSMINDPACDVIAVRLEDRFGDMGVIGAVIIRYVDCVGSIDSLMVSCRALGRNLESAIVMYVGRLVETRGVIKVRAEYRPTNKNAQVEKFYDNNAFHLMSESAGTTKYYELETLVFKNQSSPDYIKISSEVLHGR